MKNATRSHSRYVSGMRRALLERGYSPDDALLIMDGLQEQYEALCERHAEEGVEEPELLALAALPRIDAFEPLSSTEDHISSMTGGHHSMARASLLGVIGMSLAIALIEAYKAFGGTPEVSSITAILILLGYPTTFILGLIARRHVEGRAGAWISFACFSMFIGVLVLEALGKL